MSQSEKEKRLIDLAIQIDAQGDNRAQPNWRLDRCDRNSLSDDEIAELCRAQRHWSS